MEKMKLIGTLDEKEYEIFIQQDQDDENEFHVSLEGSVYTVNAHTLQSQIISVLISGKSYDIDIEEAPEQKNSLEGRLNVRVRGRVVKLEMLDERRKKLKEAQATKFFDGGTLRMTSPMPGKVLRLLAKQGQHIEEGQGLLVIEAMKMENELRAPRSGLVKDVYVNAGDPVDGGLLLMTIE